MMPGQEKNELVAGPRRFLIETLSGIVIFMIIAGAAVLLSFFVEFLMSRGVDLVIVYGLKSAEYMIFVMDLVLFFRFLWVTGKRTWGVL